MRRESEGEIEATRRSSLVVLPLAATVVLGLIWTGLWFFASSRAEATLAQWREREEKAGRVHTCAREEFGGFPFRIEVRCEEAGIELRGNTPPLTVKLRHITVVSQVWDPTHLIGELRGPLTVAEIGQAPWIAADWRLAQASVRGLPHAPERLSIVLDRPVFARAADGGMQAVAKAEHMELHARLASGTATASPVIDLALSLAQGSAAPLSPSATQSIDAELQASVIGLDDLTPKPWRERLRQWQTNNGRLDISRARVAQGDVIASANGALRLSRSGSVDGALDLALANPEQAIRASGLDKLLTAAVNAANNGRRPPDQGGGRLSQFAPALNDLERSLPGLSNSLDRLMPGLGTIVRQPERTVAALITALGQPVELEGRRAVKLPLRFIDGVAALGPIPLGRIPPVVDLAVP